MGLFDRRTPPQGSVLPTPHGPVDPPLPADADAPVDEAVVLLDEEDDVDEPPLVPVWPARPGGPHDTSAAPAAPLAPVVPIVPAVVAEAREAAGQDDAGAAEPVTERAGEATPSAHDDAGPGADGAAGAGATAEAVAVAEPVAPPAVAAPEPAPAPTGTTVDELNPAERIWLAQQRALLADLCDDPADVAAVAALFDRVRAQWAAAAERPDPRPLADAFGVALGDLVLGQAPALRWAAASDRYGTEIVLAHGAPEVLVYPLASVGQYWEDARPGWFTAQVERLTDTVRAALPTG